MLCAFEHSERNNFVRPSSLTLVVHRGQSFAGYRAECKWNPSAQAKVPDRDASLFPKDCKNEMQWQEIADFAVRIGRSLTDR